jgi:cysteine-rich repeat protein
MWDFNRCRLVFCGAAAALLAQACGRILDVESGVAQGACVEDDDCAPNHSCLLLRCRPGCANDEQCGTGARCLRSLGDSGCVPAAAGCVDCPEGTTCAADTCRTECLTYSDCAGGQICDGSLCFSQASHEPSPPVAGPDSATSTLGEDCSPLGALACDGAGQKLRLLCTSLGWQPNGICGQTENCEQDSGTCAAILAECASANSAGRYCSEDTLMQCGPDSVTAEVVEDCAGRCVLVGSEAACASVECGDGKIQLGETCDDGNADDDDGCLSACVLPECGDGHTWSGHEACDDGNVDDSDACTTTCQLPTCGDGFVWSGNETCDDKNDEDTDDCRSTCELPRCGDRVVWTGHEACDDANDDDTDDCTTQCETPMCGDGFTWFGHEPCDDGDGDDRNDCLPGCKLPSCGDGALWRGREACDDWNLAPGDGCSETCSWEPVDIDTGGFFTCALGANGRVKCWGQNQYGQLGVPTLWKPEGDTPDEMGDALTSAELGPGLTARALTLGGAHACVLLDDGAIKCWGSNGAGQLGLGDTEDRGGLPGQMGSALPTLNLGTGRLALAVTAGFQHTCALLDDGSVKCWGWNLGGQLGLGDTLTRGTAAGEMGDALPTVELGTGRSAKLITAGHQHTCALLDDDSLKCWGWGILGLEDQEPRGDGPGEMGDALPTVKLGSNRFATAVVAGDGHTCALLDDLSVKCWGQGGNIGQPFSRGQATGQMGDNLPALDLGPGRSALAISAAASHTCAVLDDRTVKCWGRNGSGQLGLGDQEDRGDFPGEMGDALPAVDLGSGQAVRTVATGTAHSCAVLDNNRVKCWGLNDHGQLGLGSNVSRGLAPGQMGDALPVLDLRF